MSEETKMANGTRQETIGNPLCLTGKLFFLGIAKDSLKADVTRVIEGKCVCVCEGVYFIEVNLSRLSRSGAKAENRFCARSLRWFPRK